MNKCKEIKSNFENKFDTKSIDFDDLFSENGRRPRKESDSFCGFHTLRAQKEETV